MISIDSKLIYEAPEEGDTPSEAVQQLYRTNLSELRRIGGRIERSGRGNSAWKRCGGGGFGNEPARVDHGVSPAKRGVGG